MDQEKIGKFIARCRKDRKLTQAELAEKLGVTNKSISNWENGRNMPEISLFKSLCDHLDISLNDLLSGEKVDSNFYEQKLEENIFNTLNYVDKKLNHIYSTIGILLISFGIVIVVTAMSIFPSESSWGSIYSILGVIISLIGISRFTRKLSHFKRLIINFGYFIFFINLLFLIDYLSVINIKQAPRFSLVKITADTTIYYDTLFYDVIRCNKDTEEEYYKIIKNSSYDKTDIKKYCD